MSSWAWIVIIVVALLGLGIAIRQKMHRDAITQNGTWVGSAMLAELVQPGAVQTRFVIVRGTAQFEQSGAFEHRGQRFRIVSYDRLDVSSTVLRRFLNVTCVVEQADPVFDP